MHGGEPSFVLVPRCIPWPSFQVTLKQLRERMSGKRIVVFEANAQNLDKYAEDIDVIPYIGQRFQAEQMHQQLEGKLDWSRCALIVVPVTNQDGSGYDNVMQFARTGRGVQAVYITPKGQLKGIPQSATAIAGSEFADYDPTAAMPGSIELVYQLEDGTLYVQGWLREQDELSSLTPCESDGAAGDNGEYDQVSLFRYMHADFPLTEGTNLGVAVFIPEAGEEIPQGLTFEFEDGGHAWLMLPDEFDKKDKPAQCLAKVGATFQKCLP